MKPYNPIFGVPLLSYYLTEITQFADFEQPHQEKIIYTSMNKDELVELCKKNNWACPDVGNSVSGWYTHHIDCRII